VSKITSWIVLRRNRPRVHLIFPGKHNLIRHDTWNIHLNGERFHIINLVTGGNEIEPKIMGEGKTEKRVGKHRWVDRGARSSLTIQMKFTLSRLPFFYIFSYNFIYLRHEHRGFLQFCVNTTNERVIFCVISQENRFVSGNSDTVEIRRRRRRKYLIGYYSMLISLNTTLERAITN
jgi:hypothetical protein